MTNYASNYSSAYQGNQPGRGTVLGDQFDASRPQLKDGLDSVPGFAAISTAWTRYDPQGDAIAFAGIDTRLQMAKLTSRDAKALCGFYKQLPLPTAIGQTLDLAIYGRPFISEIVGVENPCDPVTVGIFGGIFVADDLLVDPEASSITLAGMVGIRDTSEGSGFYGVFPSANALAAFDALPSNIGTAEETPAQYTRIRLRQVKTGASTFTSDMEIDFSETGADWNCAAVTPQIAQLRKSFGFGMWAQANGSGSLLLQFVDVISQPFDDMASRIGAPLQFGAP